MCERLDGEGAVVIVGVGQCAASEGFCIQMWFTLDSYDEGLKEVCEKQGARGRLILSSSVDFSC